MLKQKRKALIFFFLSFSLPILVLVALQTVRLWPHAQEVQVLVPSRPQDIIPGEVIIKYKEGQTPEELVQKVEERQEKSSVERAVEDLSFALAGEDTPEEKVAQLEEVRQEVKVEEEQPLISGSDEFKGVTQLKLEEEKPFDEVKTRFENVSAIEYIAPNVKGELPQIPTPSPTPNSTPMPSPQPIASGSAAVNDPRFGEQWNLEKIQVEEAWAITQGSKDVLIASIDTGIDYNHPDLPQDIIKGRDYRCFDKYSESDGQVYCDDDPMDTDGHGTGVVSILGALTNNNLEIAGINRNAKILAINVFYDENYASFWNVAKALIYAADQNARVIYVEVQGGGNCGFMPYLQEAVDYANSKGAIIISAAGNYSQDVLYHTSPATCSNIISVAASSEDDTRASYSNYGESIDIAAPGGEWIGVPVLNLSSEGNQFPGRMAGTSPATPHVAAVVSMMLAIKPDLTFQEVERILKLSADPIETDFPIGGRLNAFKALHMTQTGNIPNPTPRPVTLDPNNDGVLDIFDYSLLIEQFGPRKPQGSSPVDFDQDGDVDIFDYSNFVTEYRRSRI